MPYVPNQYLHHRIYLWKKQKKKKISFEISLEQCAYVIDHFKPIFQTFRFPLPTERGQQQQQQKRTRVSRLENHVFMMPTEKKGIKIDWSERRESKIHAQEMT